MSYKILFLCTAIAIGCTGCNSVGISSISTSTPNFVTATLPSISTPLPTQTLLPPGISTVMPTIQPIEGTTTTQINVRAETTTASESLGVIPAFSKIQIIGKDSSGSWFQVIYTQSIGWVRAEFVQVNSETEIPVVEIVSGEGSGRSAVVTSGINVRSGPGTEYDSIGVLTQNDVVFVTGKDESGSWMQIQFVGDIGWVALEFLQIENTEAIPVVGVIESTETAPVVINETPVPSTQPAQIAIQDNDSMQTPLAKIAFEENKTLQITGDVSSPQGDNEDWVEFSSFASKIVIETSCFAGELQVELWQAGSVVEHFTAPCGNVYSYNISANESYTLRIFQLNTDESSYASYNLKIKVER